MNLSASHNRRDMLRLGALGLGGMVLNTACRAEEHSSGRRTQPQNTAAMKIAYILFDRITLLDFIGIYDPISRMKSKNFLPGLEWHLCSNKEVVTDGFGLQMKMDKVLPDLSGYDMIIVPGGFGTRELRHDETFVKWLQTASGIRQKVSICTGSLLLGAAGFLEDKKATTNFNEYETLRPYCSEVLEERIVEDGDVITAGAVASSLDLGLYLCRKLIGPENTEVIRRSMDYYPRDVK